ncbi:MAG: hypothetical protein ABSD28_18295 [Tepidisphaeraceae bacterium]
MKENEITDGITTGLEVRKQRDLEIAALPKIEKRGDKGTYVVPSQNSRPDAMHRMLLHNRRVKYGPVVQSRPFDLSANHITNSAP